MTMTARSPAEGRTRIAPRWRRVGPLVTVLVAAAGSVAACGGGGSHHAASGSSNTISAPSSARQSGVAYASCMRANGVSNFPDSAVSVNDGQVTFDLPPAIKRDPQFQSAFKTCQGDLPRSSGPAKHVNVQEELEFANCMRSRGITDFPDPQPGGGFDLDELPAGAGLPEGNSGGSTESPQFAAAANACQSTGMHWNGP
jgi:hypothetical protein